MRGSRRRDGRRSSNVNSNNETTNDERTNQADARRKRSTRRVLQAMDRRRIPDPKRATNNQLATIRRNSTTRFITFNVFKSTLFRQADAFRRRIGKQPYTMILVPVGGGSARKNSGFMDRSPAWTYWLIRNIIPKPTQIVYKPDTTVIQFTNVLILDDGSYSGMQLRHTVRWVDNLVYAKNLEPIYHILVPFIKNVADKREQLLKNLDTSDAFHLYAEEALTPGTKRFVFEHKVADQVSLEEFSKFYQNLLQTRPPYKLDRAQPEPRLLRQAFRTDSPITFLELKTKRPIDFDYVDRQLSKEIAETYPVLQTEAFRDALRQVAHRLDRYIYSEGDRQVIDMLREAVDDRRWLQSYKLVLNLGSKQTWSVLRPVFESHIGVRKSALLHLLMRMHMFRTG